MSVAEQIEKLTQSPNILSVAKELAAVKLMFERSITIFEDIEKIDDSKKKAAAKASAQSILVEISKTSMSMTREAISLAKEVRSLITVEQSLRMVVDAITLTERAPDGLSKQDLMEFVLSRLTYPDPQDVGRQFSGQQLSNIIGAVSPKYAERVPELGRTIDVKDEEITMTEEQERAGRAKEAIANVG